MFEVLIQHELWTTVVLYWIFSAAVSAMLGNKGVRVTSGYRSASRHMSDDKTKRGPQDRSKINVQEKYEMDYRSKKFGVTRDELRDAVKKVGPSAAAVERELKGSA